MGAKSDVAVKLVLVFFISLLSFSIGTYIGKKYSDNQHKLAQLEPGAAQEAKRSVASEGHGDATHGESAAHAETATAGHGKDQMISDDEIKNLADDKLKKDEFIADDTAGTGHEAHGTPATKPAGYGDAHAKPVTKKADPHAEDAPADPHAKPTKEAREPAKSHSDPHATPAPKADAHGASATKPAGHAPTHAPVKHGDKHNDAALDAAESFLDGKVPAAKPTPKVENRLPSSLPKDISQYALGKFTVQIASYNTKEEAEKRAQKLKDQGYQTNVFPAKVADKMWYRVSFGLFGTNEEAQAERTKYLEKFKTESALVQKVKN